MKKGEPAWNKGKVGLQVAWNKGLTRETEPRMKNVGVFKSEEERLERGRKISESKKGTKYKITKPRISTHERKIWLNHRRRVRKFNNGGSHTQGEWENTKAQYNWTCPCCHKSEPEIRLTLDHIIPLSRGGSDNIENIQPLCKSCNSKKNAKVIKYEI